MAGVTDIDPRLVGRRLAEARRARGLTQEEVTGHLGCSRPTLIAMEKGERRAKPDEIIKLAELYGRTVHELVRPGVPATSLEPHLRAAAQVCDKDRADLDPGIAELQRFAEDYCELERILDAHMFQNYPPEVRVPSRAIADFAEDSAVRERARLGLGDQPVLNLRGVLENDVGVRIFYGGLPSTVSGIYAYAVELGYCILINVKHPPERRRATLAHEYGHFLSDRHRPGIDYLIGNGYKRKNERFAELFGLSLLMPATGVRRRFHEILTTRNDFQVADLCRLSSYYSVSVQAMALRLEGLGLIQRGVWNHLKEEGFRVRKAQSDLGLGSQQREKVRPYPQRYEYLAVQAYESEQISEGQLARFLRCDRVRAREVVSKCLNHPFLNNDTGETTDGRLKFDSSLLGGAKSR